jgi:hypothetical protein
MKKSAVKLLILLVLFNITFTKCQFVVYAEIEQPIVEVDRLIEIRNGGIVLINDLFTISGSEELEFILTDFWIGFSDIIIAERVSFELYKSGNWITLEASEEIRNGVTGSLIKFQTPLTLTNTQITLRASYLTLNSVSGLSLSYTAVLPIYPIIDFNISNHIFEVLLPTDAIFDGVNAPFNMTQFEQDDRWVVNYNEYNVSTNTTINAQITYTHSVDDDYLLLVESAVRSITVKSNNLLVEDSYSIVNKGPAIQSFPLELPMDSRRIRVYDGVGSLEIMTRDSDNIQEVEVIPRTQIQVGDRWVITISYITESDAHISTSNDINRITYPTIELPHFIQNLEAKVSRDEGVPIQLQYGATLPEERPLIESDIPAGTTMTFIRPLAILAGILAIFIAIILLRREKTPKKTEAVIEVEIPTLNNYIEQQRERLDLLKGIVSLDTDFEEEKIDKNHYDKTVVEYNRDLANIETTLQKLTQDISEEQELKDSLRKIRQADGELNRIASDLKNLEVRLRARRISRSDYERRRKDRLRRRNTAINKIEEALDTIGD